MALGRHWSALGQVASLHAASAAIALISVATGHAPMLWGAGVTAYGLVAAAVLAFADTRIPRPRGWLTMSLGLESLTLAALSGAVGIVPVRSFGLLFVLTFAWLGMHHRPRHCLALLPPAVIAYVVAVEASLGDAPPLDARGVLLMVCVCGLVGESVAVHVTRAAESAAAFRTVSSLSTDVVGTGDDLLERTMQAVLDLGYDGANLSVVDPMHDTFTVEHAEGIAADFTGTYPAGAGLTGLVRDVDAPVVIDDYQTAPGAIDAIRAAGVRTCVGVPVHADGHLAGVLIGSLLRRRRIADEHLAALTLLARAAGAGLESARQLHAEQTLNRELRDIASTDPLTGVGNRRAAVTLLDALCPGDAVTILDLDHFKRVNDTHGHQAGDDVLVQLAEHLRAQLRGSDHVVRYGGEEFLIILPATSGVEATAILDRIRTQWHQLQPLTTFSAGVATHAAVVEDTLRAADQALYVAKDAGRDRVVTAGIALGAIRKPIPA